MFLSAYLAECLGHFELKTLLTPSSAFCEGRKKIQVFFQATMQAAQFLQVPMLSTTLWQHAKMSTTLKTPDRLKDSECKKRQLSSWPPIPYVPPTDLITTKEAPGSLKIKLLDGSVFNMSIYSQGNAKEYLAHVVAVLTAVQEAGQGC